VGSKNPGVKGVRWKARGWEAGFPSWQKLAKQREHLKNTDARATKETV